MPNVNEQLLYKGQTKTIRFTALDSLKRPIDLTNAIIRSSVKVKAGDVTDVIYKDSSVSTDQAMVMADQSEGSDTRGQFEIYYVPADSFSLTAGNYAWDVWAAFPAGLTTPFQQFPIIEEAEFFIRDGVTTVSLGMPGPPAPGSGAVGGGVDDFDQYACDPSVTVGMAVYKLSLGTVAPANASSLATMPAIGIVHEKPNSTTAYVRWAGDVGGFSGLVNHSYYVDTVNGGITTTPPTAPHTVAQRMGYPRTSSIFVVQMDGQYIEQ